MSLGYFPKNILQVLDCRFTTYQNQDARRVRLVDGLMFETNILQVSLVKFLIIQLYYSTLLLLYYLTYYAKFCCKLDHCRWTFEIITKQASLLQIIFT